MINYIKSFKTDALSLPVFAVIISCVLGAFISKVSHPFLLLFAIVALAAFVIFGWKLWWLAFPVFAFIGSNINVGFKIYPEEIGFAISYSVLVLLIYLNRSPVLRKNKSLTSTFLILILYIILHMTVSLLIGPSGLLEGAGSIIRVYAASLTWLIFSCLLYRYASTNQIRIIFVVSLFVLLARNVISASELFVLITPITAKTAFFVLPTLDELRLSALLSIYIAIVVYYISNKWFVKTTIILYIVAMVSLVMLGQGRVSTATAIIIVVFWILLTKKLKIIIPLATILLFVTLTINFNKSILSKLPIQAQRAISFVPAADDLDLIGARGISGSDAWHKELLSMGLAKWTSSVKNVVFGSIIDPTDAKDFVSLPYQRMLEVAANTARYENTLGTVLATLGLVGFCLYVKLFWLLLKEIVPVVIKKGIKDYYSAVYGVAFLSVLLMVIFIWIRGGFPGFELLFCVMAKMLYDDTKATKLTINSRIRL